MKNLTFILNPKFIITGCTESQSPKHISFFSKKHTPFYLQSHHDLTLDRNNISFTMPFITITPMVKVFVSRPGELSQIVVIFLTSSKKKEKKFLYLGWVFFGSNNVGLIGFIR